MKTKNGYVGDVMVIEERKDFRRGRQFASGERIAASGFICKELAETWIDEHIRKCLALPDYVRSPFASCHLQQQTGIETVAQLRYVAVTVQEERERQEQTERTISKWEREDIPVVLMDSIIFLLGAGMFFIPYLAAFLAGLLFGWAVSLF